MLDLLQLLESFNRKERFFLISHALGKFQLSDDFRNQLSDEIGQEIPKDAYTAMDYHLEWVTAALYAHKSGDAERIFANPQQEIIKGNQEDTDLLVAFNDGEQYHLVLVEAKCATGWTNKQMKSKAVRLSQIFGPDGMRYFRVKPHFCLASPRRPRQLKASEWPEWMSNDDGSYFWIKLRFPKGRKMVTRCESNGRRSAQGNHFRIIPA